MNAVYANYDMMLIMSLQLLAVQTTLLNETDNPGNDLSPEMKTYYDMTLLDEAGPELVHAQFGQKRPIPKGKGKTIEFRKFTSLPKATTALTEGVTPSGNSLDVTAITATVSQYGDYIVMSDLLELTALDSIIIETTKLLGKQAGRTLDTVVRNKLVGGTNVNYSSTWSGTTETKVNARTSMNATSTLKVEDVRRAVTKLKGYNAPTINGDYVAIIHPFVAYDLMKDPEWVNAHQYAQPDEIYEGEIGKIAGCRFVETTEAKIWNDSTCPTKTAGSGGVDPVYYSVFATLFMGANAYGVTEVTGGGLQTIVKQKGSAGTADPLDQRSSVGWKATQTAEILLGEYIIRHESTCSFNDTAAAN